jgi:hypothetical protein
MSALIRIVLVSLYPLLLGARVVSLVRRRDPLRRREPAGSCWIPRAPVPEPRSYFSETASRTRLARPAAALRVAASVLARATGKGRGRRLTSPMPIEVPDEVYTLW